MKNTKKRIIILFVVLIGILLLINGFSYAKYISGWVWNYYLGSKGFYFTSEDLSNTTIKNVNNNWDGGSTYFTISNSLNDSVVSDYDISYKVTCSIENKDSNYACYINGTDLNEYNGTLSTYSGCTNNSGDGTVVNKYNQTTCELNGYNWVKQPAFKDIYFDVVDLEGNIVKDVIVDISVFSIMPYTKTLNGKYILHYNDSNDGKISLSYNEYYDYERLVISNSHTDNRCIEVSFDSSKFIIDIDTKDVESYSTDDLGYINMIKLNIEPKNSKSYIFYRVDQNAEFDDKIFELIENDNCS